MDEVKRKVLLDIFASPGTVVPVALGLTALMASWAMNGSAVMNFAGVAGILGGMGVLASRLILGLEKITQRAYDHVVDRNRRQQQLSLEQLDQRLTADNDPRTQNCLRQLRHLYSQLQEKVNNGQVNAASFEVIENVDKLFHSCVRQLESSVEMWNTASGLRGPARDSILGQREQLVQEVCDTVTHLSDSVQRFHMVATEKNRSELSQLRRELDESIKVARQVEQRTQQLGKPQYDAREFE